MSPGPCTLWKHSDQTAQKLEPPNASDSGTQGCCFLKLMLPPLYSSCPSTSEKVKHLDSGESCSTAEKNGDCSG